MTTMTMMKTKMMRTSKSDFTKTCVRCALHRHRTQVVFGKGSKRSGIVICGEAPGKDEDRKGRPFVGRCGKILKAFLKSAGLRRKDVFITNACLCRPLNNRPPTKAELRACRPRLRRTIRQIAQGVLILGRSAARAVLNVDYPIWGVVYKKYGIPMVCLKHPGYLLHGHMIELEYYIKDFVSSIKTLQTINHYSFKRTNLELQIDLDVKDK